VIVEEKPHEQRGRARLSLPLGRQTIEELVDSETAADSVDVRKHVERAERSGAADAFDVVQRGNEIVAPPLELRDHPSDDLGRLRTLERFPPGLLDEGRHTAHEVDIELLERRRLALVGKNAPAEPPARSWRSLSVAARDDGALAHPGTDAMEKCWKPSKVMCS
jgi:hypothetical protein